MNNILLNKLTTILLLVFSVFLLFIISKKALIIIIPFFIGYLLSNLFTPLIKSLHIKNKYLRGIVIILLISLFISMILAIFYYIGQQLGDSLSRLVDNREQIQHSIISYYDKVFKQLKFLSLDFKFNLESTIETSVNQLLTFIAKESRTILDKSIDFIIFLPEILVFVIITFLSCFFFTKDHELIEEKYRTFHQKYISKIKSNKYYQLFVNKILHVFIGYLKAQLILMSITFIICSIGLFVLNINNFLLKAFIISLVDALPIFGTAIFFIPWSISKFLIGNYQIGVGLLILYGFNTITRQLLEPKIFGEQIGLYPLLTLFSIYAGLKIFGVLGIFIGPITAIFIKTFIQNTKNTNVF